MLRAGRSFTLPPGLFPYSFAKILTLGLLVILVKSTMGVFPINDWTVNWANWLSISYNFLLFGSDPYFSIYTYSNFWHQNYEKDHPRHFVGSIWPVSNQWALVSELFQIKSTSLICSALLYQEIFSYSAHAPSFIPVHLGRNKKDPRAHGIEGYKKKTNNNGYSINVMMAERIKVQKLKLPSQFSEFKNTFHQVK